MVKSIAKKIERREREKSKTKRSERRERGKSMRERKEKKKRERTCDISINREREWKEGTNAIPSHPLNLSSCCLVVLYIYSQ